MKQRTLSLIALTLGATVGIASAADYIVFKDGSNYKTQQVDNRSNQKFNGTNAAAAINAGINNAGWGGTVYLERGEYSITQSIKMKSGVSLQGESSSTTADTGTVLVCGSSSLWNMIKHDGSYVNQIAIRDIAFNADGETSVNLGAIKMKCRNSFFEDLNIDSFYGPGLHLQYDSVGGNKLENVRLARCRNKPLIIEAPNTTGHLVETMTCGTPTTSAAIISGAGSYFEACFFDAEWKDDKSQGAKYNVEVRDSVTFRNCRFATCTKALVYLNAVNKGVNLSNVKFYGCTFNYARAPSDGYGHHILGYTSSSAKVNALNIQGCIFKPIKNAKAETQYKVVKSCIKIDHSSSCIIKKNIFDNQSVTWNPILQISGSGNTLANNIELQYSDHQY